MKMKKTYAAALAAALVLTAGFSAQAANFNFTGSQSAWWGTSSITGTGTIEDSEIVDAVESNPVHLATGSTIEGYATTDEIAGLATKDELAGYATMDALNGVATDTAYAKTTAESALSKAQTNENAIGNLQ